MIFKFTFEMLKNTPNEPKFLLTSFLTHFTLSSPE